MVKGQKCAAVNVTGYGFHSHSRKYFFLNHKFLYSAEEAKLSFVTQRACCLPQEFGEKWRTEVS